MIPPEQPSDSFQESLGERLIGLALILGGVIGFGIVFLMWRFAPAAMPVPPGLPRDLLPIVSPLNCILPIVAIGSSLLVLIGLKRLVFGE